MVQTLGVVLGRASWVRQFGGDADFCKNGSWVGLVPEVVMSM